MSKNQYVTLEALKSAFECTDIVLEKSMTALNSISDLLIKYCNDCIILQEFFQELGSNPLFYNEKYMAPVPLQLLQPTNLNKKKDLVSELSQTSDYLRKDIEIQRKDIEIQRKDIEIQRKDIQALEKQKTITHERRELCQRLDDISLELNEKTASLKYLQ
jgi:hypothetical protein